MDKRRPSWSIQQVMTRSPATVRPDTSVEELNGLFRAHDFGAFPVVDEHGSLCGIVTKLDLLRALRPEGGGRLAGRRGLRGRRVDEIMSRGVVTVTPDDRAETAADLMIEHRLRNLPVVDRRTPGQLHLVGILSRTDLLRCLAPPLNRVDGAGNVRGAERRPGAHAGRARARRSAGPRRPRAASATARAPRPPRESPGRWAGARPPPRAPVSPGSRFRSAPRAWPSRSRSWRGHRTG